MLCRACVFLLCFSVPVLGQQGEPTAGVGGQSQGVIAQPAGPMDRRVRLDVVVTDKSGKPVAGLQQQDFTVLDNKQPQNVLSFRAVGGETATADPPVEIILLVDEVNASYQAIAFERDGIERFLRQNGGKLAHPVTLAFFTDTGTQIQNGGTSDGNALLASVAHVGTDTHTIPRSTGFYGAVERFQLSLSTVDSLAARYEKKPGRKLLIWISPGWPLLSGPRVDLTAKEQQGIFNSIVGVSAALRRANITLYSVDPRGATAGLRDLYYEEYLKAVPAAKNAQSGNLALQVVATHSGGLVLGANNDLTSEISRAVADASAYYILSFEGPPADHANEYHGVEVRVDKPGLAARTRTGYYAQP